MVFRAQMWGIFDIVGPDDVSVLPKGAKSRAMIATLCDAPDWKRSRTWLRAIFWADDPPERAAASLRQALKRLKASRICREGLLRFDETTLWLDRGALDPGGPRRGEADYLEGLDVGAEPFEDWLRDARRAAAAEPVPTATHRPPRPPTPAPTVALLPVIAATEQDRLLGDAVMEVILRTLFQAGCVEVSDLRLGLGACLDARAARPGHCVALRVLRQGAELGLSVQLLCTRDGRVVWGRWFDRLGRSLARDRPEQFLALAGAVANVVHDHLAQQAASGPDDGLFGAIHHVLSHSRAGQTTARALLAERAEGSGLARAWLIYTYAVAHAERHGGLDATTRAELREHCACALQDAPDNPMVRAIVGHIEAFVFRRLDVAADHHATARELGPTHPLVWTLSAMHRIYVGDAPRAYALSQRAMALSRHHPYRFFFEGPHSIACTLTTRHAEAIALGRRILDRKPNFLAVMRHMAASQVCFGDRRGARATIDAIRERDPRFIVPELAHSDYPLPSPASVALIGHALQVAG